MKESGSLAGRRILLVEDESLVSMLAEDVLTGAGAFVLLAMRLGEALELARSEAIDVAVLDVNLGAGDTSYPVAAVLAARSIPFLFATGYGANGIDPAFSDRNVVQKPYKASELVQAALNVSRPRSDYSPQQTRS